jgi:hypothetical protein
MAPGQTVSAKIASFFVKHADLLDMYLKIMI